MLSTGKKKYMEICHCNIAHYTTEMYHEYGVLQKIFLSKTKQIHKG